MGGFEAYQLYVSLKKHFSSTGYDYFKYNGKSKVSFEKFKNRKDIIWFKKLAKHKDIKGLLIANFLVNPEIWIGEVLSSEGETSYVNWKKRKESLSYIYKSEVNKLSQSHKFNDLFIVVDGEHPNLIKYFLRQEICVETLVILCDLTRSVPYWNKKLKNDIIWYDLRLKIEKYQPFMKYDKEMYREITKSFW